MVIMLDRVKLNTTRTPPKATMIALMMALSSPNPGRSGQWIGSDQLAGSAGVGQVDNTVECTLHFGGRGATEWERG